jgi:hypothetical protein
LIATSCATTLLFAACGPGLQASDRTNDPASRIATSTTTTTDPPTTTTTEPPTTTTTTAPEEPGWTTLSTGPRGIAIDERGFPQPDGSQITVVRFLAGHVDYSLHVGSQDPPTGQASIGPDSGPAVGGAERPLMLACFNGGFLASARAGGFEVWGQVLEPLAAGLATFEIDATGLGHVGVWGQDLPVTGVPVTSVRQNLAPLVLNGAPNPQAGAWGLWGATLGGGAAVARSALGQDANGNLLYAGSMSTVPIDLANALVSGGATTAMELDINPEWVHVATAPTPGGPLTAQIPGQNRPADLCQVGWTRDFVVVMSVG